MNGIVSGFNEFGAVSVEEAMREVERLLGDPGFKSPERNRRFLRFVCDEYFDGRGDALKAYTIAVDAFGRPTNFDPSTDSIVRIEAVRLRNALSQYYEAHPDAEVRIDLPKGRYVPMFTRACPLAASKLSLLKGDLPDIRAMLGLRGHVDDKDRAEPRSAQRNVTVTIAATAIVLVVAFLIYWGFGAPLVMTDKPSVAIDMKIAADDASGEVVRDEIMVSLSQFQTLRTAWGNSDAGSAPAVFTSGIVSTVASTRLSNAYRVTLKHSEDADGQSVLWQVVDVSTGETLRSGVEQALTGVPGELSSKKQLARQVAARLAGRLGVINELEIAHEYASPTLGNGCVLRTMAKIDAATASDLANAKACLSATLAAAPNDADANAVMSLVLANASPDEAMAFADKAVMLAPSSDRARMAQSIALYQTGKIDAAITAGYRAMTMNPADSAIASKLSSMVYLTGRWEDGVALAIKSGLFDTSPHRNAAMTLALDAYRTGAYDEALFRARQMTDGDVLDDILVAATLGRQGKSEEARIVMTEVRTEQPDVEETFRSDLVARRFPLILIDALQDGLIKAGATFH